MDKFDKNNKKTGGDITKIHKSYLTNNECLFERDICTPNNELNYFIDFLKEMKINIDFSNKQNVIENIKNILHVKKESEIWENNTFKNFVGKEKANYVVKNIFKPIGPSDSYDLLDNFNIDNALKQWCEHSIELFKRKFYHIPYQMIDFDKVKSELSKINIMKLISNGYDCFGVVLNTDVSTGGGKHWFALFSDFKHNGTDKDPYTLEYFNSSGNKPMTEVDIFLERTRYELLKNHGKYLDIIRSAPKRLQHDDNSCGIWSIMYIYSRLKGHPYDWFYKVDANDKDMFLLRSHFFRKK